MVLETAAFDDVPTNDSDPYGSTQQSNEVRIDLSKAHRPFPILGGLEGFGNKTVHRMTSEIVRQAPKIIDRPLTQDEVDAVVTSVSKYTQVHSWIFNIGGILGAVRANSTEGTYTWPLQRFIPAKTDYTRFGPWRGARAKSLWDVARFSTWVLWWSAPAYVIGAIVGQAFMAQSQMLDQRLAQFHKDMRSEVARKRLGNAVVRRQQGVPTPMETSVDMQESGWEPGQRLKSRFEKQSSGQISENGQEDYQRAPSAQSSPQPFGATPGREAYSYEPQPQESRPVSSTLEQSSNASGGSAWDRVRNQAGQRESAWDRVRRQTGSADQSPSSGAWQSRNEASLSDSFTFDEREEDKQLAKAEAQRDFDARVERERQGKDFSDARGRTGRW